MKILVFIDSLGAGGAERSMLDLVKFLKGKAEVQVSIACLRRQKFSFEDEARNLEVPLVFNEEGAGFRSKIRFLKKVVNRQQPDIIHSTLTEANLVVRLFLITNRRKDIKVIQSLVNTPYSMERKKDSHLPWQKFQMVKQIDIWTARIAPEIFYHVITQRVLEHYKPLYRIKDNYRVIYRGRRQNPFVGDKKTQKNFTLINVGRQEFAKGQIDILKALKVLREQYEINDIHLEVLGRPGEYSNELNKFIKENDLKDQVELRGLVNDVEERLVKADVFVFPSYYEGLGGALLEAFAAKLPCICSNIPVLKEVVGSEKGALFCNPGDFEKLAQNIKKLYLDQELRKSLADYALDNFQTRFRIEEVSSKMMEMYHDLITLEER